MSSFMPIEPIIPGEQGAQAPLDGWHSPHFRLVRFSLHNRKINDKFHDPHVRTELDRAGRTPITAFGGISVAPAPTRTKRVRGGTVLPPLPLVFKGERRC